MAHFLENTLIFLVVSSSAIYAVYALSPVSVKRIMLGWLIRCCGLKVYAWLSPRVGSCTQCATDIQKRSVVHQFQQVKAPSKITAP
jgi:hypothetical protein